MTVLKPCCPLTSPYLGSRVYTIVVQ